MSIKLPFRDFDEWVTYVFDRPVDEDEAWYWKEDHPFDPNQLDEPTAPSQLCLEYCTTLFSDPGFLLDRFSLAQINQAIWFIAHESCSSHMLAPFDKSLPWSDRRRCIESIYYLNQKLFAVACDEICSHVETPANPLNGICYMFCALLPNGVEYIFPESYLEVTADQPPGDLLESVPVDPDSLLKYADEHQAMLDTMERILSLPSVACREQALHGLGHFHKHRPREVERIVDGFLAREANIPDDLRSYAQAARAGEVI